MSILKRSSNLDSLLKKSASIMDVFTKTQQDCIKVNEEISAVVQQREEEIKNLQSEVSTLNGQHAKNKKLADKIETFLNE